MPVGITDAVEQSVALALLVGSSPQGACNLHAMVAGDFVDFARMCQADTDAAGEYNLHLVDAALPLHTSTQETPHGRTVGAMAHRRGSFDFKGEHSGSEDKPTRAWCDEYVMDKVRARPVAGDLDEMGATLERVRAYARLCYRVRAHTELVERCEQATVGALADLVRQDRALWTVFVEQGKQHLDGIEASLADIDGHSWERDKNTTRNDLTAQPWVRNGKSFHTYCAARGSVSERDMMAD